MDSGPSKQDYDAYQREIYWQHKVPFAGYLPGTIAEKLEEINPKQVLIQEKLKISDLVDKMTLPQLLELKKQVEKIKATSQQHGPLDQLAGVAGLRIQNVSVRIRWGLLFGDLKMRELAIQACIDSRFCDKTREELEAMSDEDLLTEYKWSIINECDFWRE